MYNSRRQCMVVIIDFERTSDDAEARTDIEAVVNYIGDQVARYASSLDTEHEYGTVGEFLCLTAPARVRTH